MSGLFQGRFESGVRAWADAHASCLRSGNLQIECWSLMGQADNLVRLGRDGEAVELYHEALERFAGSAHTTESIWVHGMLALASLRTGDDAAADRHAREALELLSSARPMAYWTQFGTAATYEVFLALAARMGDDALGRGGFLRKAERARAAMRDFARSFPMGRPFHLLLDGWYHWLRGHERRAMRCWSRCVTLAESLGTPYELGRACFEIASHSPEDSPQRRAHLERAREVFLACGAARELALANAISSAPEDIHHAKGVAV
jgi:eukaryotic-like serine/threonine-protein kinase